METVNTFLIYENKNQTNLFEYYTQILLKKFILDDEPVKTEANS